MIGQEEEIAKPGSGWREGGDSPPSKLRHRRELLPLVVCCAALLGCLLLAHPFVNSPFNDDWSYSHVAYKLAETGRFHYNGWGSPTIVFQSLWGAMFIRLFGFSFNVLRVATLPFSIGFVALTYLLARRVGLRRDLSFFCSLCVAISPLFVPLAASFMTEPYSCFFSLLCVYAAACCAESPSQRSAIAWLLVLTVSGILGGSTRQTVWAAPLALIPYLLWLRRSDRRFTLFAAGSLAACLGSMLFVVANFSQKYGPMEMTKRQLLLLAFVNGIPAIHLMCSVVLSCLLMSLPAFLCLLPLWKRLPVRHGLGLVMLCLVVFDFLLSGFGVGWGTVPFVGNILTVRGLIGRWADGLGYRPVMIHHSVTYPLTYLLLFFIAAFVYLTVPVLKGISVTKLRPVMAVLFIFVLSYLPFLIPGALILMSFDRYMLPILPIALILILLPHQDAIRGVPLAAWICLATFAMFGVVTTHDYYASLQARSDAVKRMTDRGVQPNHISGGLERDAWQQLQTTGHVNPSLYHDKVAIDYNKHFFWFYASAITPDYVAVAFALDRAPKNALASSPFLAWTPPYKRVISVVRKADIPYDQDYLEFK